MSQKDMESSPRAIEKQLEALIKWREGYRVILEAKHVQERAMLETQERSFEMYCATDSIEYKTMENEDKKTGAVSEERENSEESVPELSKRTSGYSTESIPENLKIGTKDSQSSTNSHAPRKFLRRGEGIKQRFKISPDAFNLRKLPPYKYANAHPNLRQPANKVPKPPNVSKEKVVQTTEKAEREPQEKPAKLDIQEQHFQRLLFESKTTANSTPQEKPAKLEMQEQHFQRLLFESKTTANSTPDPKSIIKSVSNSSVASKSNNSVKQADESQPRSVGSSSSQSCNSLPMSIAWSKVLDPLNIKPITVSELRLQQAQQKQASQLDETDDEHLNLFELLEAKAKEGSFNLNSSVIKRLLTKKVASKREDEQDSDIIPVTTEVREAQILPKLTVDVQLDSSDSDSDAQSDESGDDDDEEDDDEYGESCETRECTSSTKANETNINNTDGKSPQRLHVRFVENVDQTVEDETANTLNEDTLCGMNTEMLFEHAKDLIWDAMAQNQKNVSEANFTSNSQLSAEDIRRLAEQSKARLTELEKQIAFMKENNAQLLKAKQEHELEKVVFMQQQEEALEQINDEKVQMELQLHDERMKLEDERRKLEEKLRMQKTAIVSNERKEIAKLKEEIAVLKSKLRDKEQTHVAAQGRLRSQIRCLEKEQRDLYAEIENLKKENAKLLKLNAQLSREQNVTMLNEINRNIVKLAGSKSNTPPNNETASKSSKSLTSSKTSLKRSDSSRLAAKTLKITTSSFANLNMMEASADVEDIEVDESMPHTSNFERSADTIDSNSTTSNTQSISVEKSHSNDTTMGGFKVLTRETMTEDGGKEILYPNGTLRKDSGDGMTVRMMYFNGDVKETNVNEGTIKYYYAKTNTWHTTYLDGLEILEFPNGQVEHRQPNGTIEIHFPNNSVKVVDPKDEEKLAEWRFQDGSTLFEMRNGDRLLMLSNGQKELHTKQFKRREYPDGTVKTVFPDGSYETRYSNGRIRLKDKHGNLIMDSEMQTENK